MGECPDDTCQLPQPNNRFGSGNYQAGRCPTRQENKVLKVNEI